jgi:hypothetical protein
MGYNINIIILRVNSQGKGGALSRKLEFDNGQYSTVKA